MLLDNTSIQLLAVSKILKIESKSQRLLNAKKKDLVVSSIKDTQNWKQITTQLYNTIGTNTLLAVSKILKIESKSQLA